MDKNTEKIFSFPHMANYHIPIEFLLKLIFKDSKILVPPPTTKRTLELGSKYSPDFVCVPFKYNLGNYIEALENGANVLIQAGGGCRFGYYGEAQEQILKDLGYDFEFIYLVNNAKVNILEMYKKCKEMGSKLSFPKFSYYILLTIKMINIMDKIDFYIRETIGFEVQANSFHKLQAEFFNKLKLTTNFKSLHRTYKEYNERFHNLKINKPNHPLKVGIIGELYSLMEPFSNYFIEKELAEKNIVVSRYINVTYLLFQKTRQRKKTIRDANGYLKYAIGADGTDSVAKGIMLAKKHYDGIIHLKPFGCTPEVNSMPMLQNINKDYKIPILYFSFDSQTSETGVKTRLEAFYDMIIMRKSKESAEKDESSYT